nr:hypothetical protein CFP56_33548 [Quercus suber]
MGERVQQMVKSRGGIFPQHQGGRGRKPPASEREVEGAKGAGKNGTGLAFSSVSFSVLHFGLFVWVFFSFSFPCFFPLFGGFPRGPMEEKRGEKERGMENGEAPDLVFFFHQHRYRLSTTRNLRPSSSSSSSSSLPMAAGGRRENGEGRGGGQSSASSSSLSLSPLFHNSFRLHRVNPAQIKGKSTGSETGTWAESGNRHMEGPDEAGEHHGEGEDGHHRSSQVKRRVLKVMSGLACFLHGSSLPRTGPEHETENKQRRGRESSGTSPSMAVQRLRGGVVVVVVGVAHEALELEFLRVAIGDCGRGQAHLAVGALFVGAELRGGLGGAGTNVADVRHVGGSQDGHLLLRRAHEEEATGVEQKGRQVLEAVDLGIDIAAGGADERGAVAEDERDLDDAHQPGGHQRVAEHGVDVRAQHQGLRVRAHAPAREQNDDCGDQVALRAPLTIARQPHADQSGGPPDDPHARVLQIIVHPRIAPPVLGERVDAAPDADDQAVPELLATAGPREECLSVQKQERQDNPVPDERRAHDEMRRALSRVLTLTEALSGDTAKQHLHPRRHRKHAAQNPMAAYQPRPYLANEPSLQMQPQIYSSDHLCDEHDHQPVRELRMYILSKLSSFVQVAQEISHYRERCRHDLRGDMPS